MGVRREDAFSFSTYFMHNDVFTRGKRKRGCLEVLNKML